ncbi:MAG: TetR/AcrR family transcriptional regulator [Actinomycetota bacterium]
MNGYQRRKQQKRESIQRAALELFSIHGIKKVSIAEIAERANVNPVTIFNHFQNKDGLIRDVIDLLIADQWEKYRKILKSEQSFLQKLEQIVASKVESANLYNSELLQTALSADRNIRVKIETLYRDEITPLLIKFIKEGQESGHIRRNLSADAVAIYFDMFIGLAHTHPELFSDKKQTSNSTREIWSLFLYGLMGTNSGGKNATDKSS